MSRKASTTNHEDGPGENQPNLVRTPPIYPHAPHLAAALVTGAAASQVGRREEQTPDMAVYPAFN